MEPGEVFLHLALVLGVLGGLSLLARLVVPGVVILAAAAGIYALSRRTPPRALPPAPTVVLRGAGAEEPPTPQDSRGSRRPPEVARAGAVDPAADAPIPDIPPRPTGRTARAWAPASRRVEASCAGHPAAGRLLRAAPARDLDATLVTGPARPGPASTPRVAVYVREDHVADLSDDLAAAYGPELRRLAEAGIDLRVGATLRAQTSGAVSISLALPGPGGIASANTVPRGSFVVLPHGEPIHVEGVEEHRDVVDAWLRPGHDVWLALTLRRGSGTREDEAEVALDAQPVGTLSADAAADLLPLLDYCAARRLAPVAVAALRGSSLRADLRLHCVRAQDADETWLRSLGPAPA